MWHILSILWLIFIGWAIFMTIFTHKMLNKKMEHIRNPPMPLLATCPIAARYDYIEWPRLQIYIGAIFLLPIRVLSMVIIVVVSTWVTKISWMIFGSNFLIFA